MELNNPFKCTLSPISNTRHTISRYWALLLLLLFLGMGSTGCVTLADPEASQDYTADGVTVLDAQTKLGQSFVSRRPNLNGITIWITRLTSPASQPLTSNQDVLEVKLFWSLNDPNPVFATFVSVPASADRLPVTISIPDHTNLAGQAYYLLLSNSSGTIQVNGRDEDAYSLGQAYVNQQPINADIAFRLTYDYGFSSFVQDIKTTSSFLWLIIPLLVVLWLPGWLLLEFSGLRSHFDFGEQTALATALSMALIPVLMLWTTILKLRWSSRSLYIVAGILIAIFVGRLIYSAIMSLRKRKLAEDFDIADDPPGFKKSKLISWHSLALLLVFIAALLVRLIMIRDLATPAWVDSVHHALFTRLIMQDGAYPSTYLPILSFPSTAYHLGFHSIAATFTWLSQLDLVHSLLILGQVLNALIIFSVYLFSKTLTGSPSAALLAAIISAFLTPMPAYYTSWGRYTELTGLLLLPVIIALIQFWMEGKVGRRSYWVITLCVIIAAGMFMIHYRVLAFLVCLVISYFAYQYTLGKKSVKRRPLQSLLVISTVVVLAIILVMPWFIQTVKTALLPHITVISTAAVPLFQDFSWPYLTAAFGTQTLVIAGLGSLWDLLKGRRMTLLLILWVVLLFLLANLAALKLPGGGLVNNSSVAIMLFIPISLLGGFFIDQLIAQWKNLIPPPIVLPAIAIFVLWIAFVSYLGARQLVAIINPITILTRSADLSAIEWVQANIPPDETVVINPFAWGYGLYAGNDGGYWISPLAGRPTLPRPVIYGLDSDAAQISQLSQQVIDLSSDPSALRIFLDSNQLHYLYIGVRGGVISPEKLSSSGVFDVIYHQDGIWIFKVKP